MSLLGRVPQRGEIVAHPAGYEFEVLEADPRRVKRLRIRRGEHSVRMTACLARLGIAMRGLTGWRRFLLRLCRGRGFGPGLRAGGIFSRAAAGLCRAGAAAGRRGPKPASGPQGGGCRAGPLPSGNI